MVLTVKVIDKTTLKVVRPFQKGFGSLEPYCHAICSIRIRRQCVICDNSSAEQIMSYRISRPGVDSMGIFLPVPYIEFPVIAGRHHAMRPCRHFKYSLNISPQDIITIDRTIYAEFPWITGSIDTVTIYLSLTPTL